MVYEPNVPQAGQSLGTTQPIINENFMLIQSVFDVNHRDYNLSSPGTHIHVDLLAQASNPNPATGLVSHYSKSVSGITEWFFQRENSGTVMQMSTFAGDPSATANGQTFLPGGLILKWGTFTATTSGTVVTFKNGVTASPFPNAVFAVILTSQVSNPTPSDVHLAVAPTVNGFVGETVNFNCTAYYMAIGN